MDFDNSPIHTSEPSSMSSMSSSTASDFTSDDLDGSHLLTFQVNDAEADAVDSDFVPLDDEGQAIPVESLEPEQMTRDAFCAVWNTAWNIPGMMLPEYKPLQITEEKQEASSEAADAIYDLAQDHFPWLISGQNSTFGAVLRILPFGLVQAGAVRAILTEKRRAKATINAQAQNEPQGAFKSRRTPEAANSPEAPPAPPVAAETDNMGWMDDERAAA